MFAKAKCKLCGSSVRLALRHLNESHPEVFVEIKKMKMPDIMEKYFS